MFFIWLISKIDITLKSIEQVLNLPKLIESAIELERQASEPNLWDDPQAAQVITSKLSRAQSTINKISSIRTRLDDLPVMLELAGNESDKAAAYKDIDQELDNLTKIINDLEVQTLLSSEYDERDALMTIRSEAGGVEAADWAQMLMRMYVRFCERHNYKIDVLETSYAEEAGIKSTTFRISAPYAYGRLSVEQGTHRLVRISPFDSQSRRHTSFAGVEVVPVVEQSDHIEIEDAHWVWHVGLDAQASGMLNDLYAGSTIDEDSQRRMLCLFVLNFENPSDMLSEVSGKSVYLAMAMDTQQLLKIKPQNLLLNLPLARRS